MEAALKRQTSGIVAIVILIVVGIVFLVAFIVALIHLIRSVWRGDIQIESTSHGRQFLGRSEKNRDTD
jgi:hypothetical protein